MSGENESPTLDGRAIQRGKLLSDFYSRLEHRWPGLVERLHNAPRQSGRELGDLLNALIQALADPDTSLREGAAFATGLFKSVLHGRRDDDELDRAAVAGLTKALADADAHVRLEAVRSLAKFAKATSLEVVDALSLAAEDSDPNVRVACVATLQAHAAALPVPIARALVRIITSQGVQDADLVVEAIRALRMCGPDAASGAVDAMAAVLRDARRPLVVRVAICETLEWLAEDARGAADALLDVMLDRGDGQTDNELRVAAASALVRVANLPALLAGQSFTEEDRRTTLSLLRQVGPNAGDTRRTLEAEWREDQAPSAAPATSPLSTDNIIGPPADGTPTRLAAVEAGITELKKLLKTKQADQEERTFYTTKEVAEATEFSEWTIRRACKTGRIDNAEKGSDGAWRIPRAELLKIQNHGLPPENPEKASS